MKVFLQLERFALWSSQKNIKIHETLRSQEAHKAVEKESWMPLEKNSAGDGFLFVRFYWAICWIDNIFSPRMAFRVG